MVAGVSPPRLATVAKVAAAVLAARLLYRMGRLVYNVLTSVPRAAEVAHQCIPPPDYKPDPAVEAASRAFLEAHFPELADLATRGNLVVLQPASMLATALREQQQQQGPRGPDQAPNALPQAGAFMPANSAAATVAEGPGLQQADVAELLSCPGLQGCVANVAPQLLVFVGTVHVAKQSADDVTRVIKALRPARVALELCPSRLQAMLLDPFADPLSDLEPCPAKAAVLSESKNRSLAQIFEATLKSRDHNVLMAALSGMYARLEDQLKVSAGVEFLAARRALIELQREEDEAAAAAAAQAEAGPGTTGARAGSGRGAATGPRRGGRGSSSDGGYEGTWLARCIAADRSVMDTLMGLWAALGPWKRLQLLWDMACMLLWKLDEKLIASLANEDLVDSLLEELGADFPELLKPLLHDRNFVLATNTWMCAQHTDGPVLAVVGKGHLPGIVFVVQQLVGWMKKTGGMPIRLVAPHGSGVGSEDEGEEVEAAVAGTAAAM